MYTTPLKALSNQKHADLAGEFGMTVGLMTGDRVENPYAPIVVMTTEVLRSLLYARAQMLVRLDIVVLDEFHWIQDPHRGGVGRGRDARTRDATLVCLSATLPGADVIAAWIESVHGPVGLVEETTRPVELHYLYGIGSLRRDPPSLVPMLVDGEANSVIDVIEGPLVRRGDESLLRRRTRDRRPRRHTGAHRSAAGAA